MLIHFSFNFYKLFTILLIHVLNEINVFMQIYTWFFFLNFREQKGEQLSKKNSQQKVGRRKQELRLKKILKIDSMSNDEECDDGFITHPPPRQSDTWRTLWRVAVIQDVQCDGRYNTPCLQ